MEARGRCHMCSSLTFHLWAKVSLLNLEHAQLANLDLAQLAGLELTQLASLELAQLANLELTQLASLELTRLAGLELTQLASLELAQLASSRDLPSCLSPTTELELQACKGARTVLLLVGWFWFQLLCEMWVLRIPTQVLRSTRQELSPTEPSPKALNSRGSLQQDWKASPFFWCQVELGKMLQASQSQSTAVWATLFQGRWQNQLTTAWA